MKKILLSTIVLTLFALSIILFDISCKKTANADPSLYVLPVATTSKLGGVIPDGTTISVDGTGKISTIGTAVKQENKVLYETSDGGIGTANYDGTNPQKINIVLPSGLSIDAGNNLEISPDHKTIFFAVNDNSANAEYNYACNIDGTNIHKVVNGYITVPY
jgi:hypothetical protein